MNTYAEEMSQQKYYTLREFITDNVETILNRTSYSIEASKTLFNDHNRNSLFKKQTTVLFNCS